MKFTIASALTLLALTPIAAVAVNDGEEAVSYDDALKCSALYGLLADLSEGEDAEILKAEAARWLIAAMSRDGSEDGSQAQGELELVVQALITELEEMPDDSEEVLIYGIDFCEGKYDRIAEEMDAIEF